jgi:hypothetical protein
MSALYAFPSAVDASMEKPDARVDAVYVVMLPCVVNESADLKLSAASPVLLSLYRYALSKNMALLIVAASLSNTNNKNQCWTSSWPPAKSDDVVAVAGEIGCK